MSAFGGKADSLAWPSECLPIAEAVEKVPKLKVFETMIQKPGFHRINIATSAVYRSDSCAKLDGPDFFNSLSQERSSPNPLAYVHVTVATILGIAGLFNFGHCEI